MTCSSHNFVSEYSGPLEPTLYQWVRRSRRFEATQCLQMQKSREGATNPWKGAIDPWRWRHYIPFEKWGTTRPKTEDHIPEDLNLQRLLNFEYTIYDYPAGGSILCPEYFHFIRSWEPHVWRNLYGGHVQLSETRAISFRTSLSVRTDTIRKENMRVNL